MKKEMYKYKIFGIYVFLFVVLSIFANSAVITDKDSAAPGENVAVQCEASVGDVTSVKASINGVDCTFQAWTFVIASFNCPAPAADPITVECFVDPTVSFTSSTGKQKDTKIICPRGKYPKAGSCANCGGIRLCSVNSPKYCGVSDGICPSDYQAGLCNNHAGCGDPDC